MYSVIPRSRVTNCRIWQCRKNWVENIVEILGLDDLLIPYMSHSLPDSIFPPAQNTTQHEMDFESKHESRINLMHCTLETLSL